ncbi:Permease of the drug/metabolite transporter (DMT) superfamily [Fulvivirga imtechensis AK7]|uniref:Permease of the drug/metabolite transporter (DMT) superfamily n=2 Tax=Fulvivirga TaxID=396811 RepID=L8JMW4_9BACT|nr:Permease of the drug/metabolite transporter (DMT) superfamily [Fulvivirga imtechensis AK7]
MVMLVAYLLGKESITIKKVIGVLVGGTGAYLLLSKSGFSINNETFIGDLLILINGASYAVYLAIVKPLMAKYRAITVIKWIFLLGGIMTLPFGSAQLAQVEWSVLPPIVWFSIIFIVVATFLSYLLNVWALKFVNSSVVGSYIYLQPVFATFIAVTFRDDQLHLSTVVYSLIIMFGVYLVSQK